MIIIITVLLIESLSKSRDHQQRGSHASMSPPQSSITNVRLCEERATIVGDAGSGIVD